MKIRNYLFTILMLGALMNISAQSSTTAPANSTAQANPKDVDSIEHIVAAVYDCISGPAGARNWDRFRSLYYPGARMIPTFRDKSGAVVAKSSTVDEYAERAGAYFAKEGFFESAVANRVESWDHIAHVWSTYESRHAKGESRLPAALTAFS
jgi:hypothetical protein